MNSEQRKICVSRRQRGAAAVEFAVLSILFLTMIFAIVEFGRVLFVFNAATEATRWAARTAVVCDLSTTPSTAIVARMQAIFPGLTAANVNVLYQPTGCDANTCTRVEVRVADITLTPMTPLLAFAITLPDFATTLPRESLTSDLGAGGVNPDCSAGA